MAYLLTLRILLGLETQSHKVECPLDSCVTPQPYMIRFSSQVSFQDQKLNYGYGIQF